MNVLRISLVPGTFRLHGSGEKAVYRLQCLCVITLRIHRPSYISVFFRYMLHWKKCRCRLAEDGRSGPSALTCSHLTLKGEQLLSVKTVYKEKDICVATDTVW